MADLIIITVLAGAVFLILRARFTGRRRGRCGGGCSGCSGCGCGAKGGDKDAKALKGHF